MTNIVGLGPTVKEVMDVDIAIIGAGNVGTALAGSLVRAGHSVAISAADGSHARRAALASGARAAADNIEAARAAEVVVLAVPYAAVPDLLAEIGGSLEGKVVVDVTNPLRSDLGGLATATSAAEEIQARLPAARVVKALNTAFAVHQADPHVEGTEVDGFVAGDDAAARAKVLALVESIGFRPIDAGPLTMARALASLALLNISLQVRHGWSWQSGWKLVGPTTAAA
ncbi:MAG TPA: NAD(P)-binding domain-containing protein [Candidatus Limnocylindrales bacterium]|nr:NAD(P)-binding domain-containing protein [Candidatus Limnocylindrales bacterium]